MKTSWRLKIDRISYGHLNYNLIEDSELELEANMVYGLMGKSGSGKTTLWEALIGYPRKQRDASFTIYKNNSSWQSQRNIAFLPQQPAYTLNPSRKVRSMIIDIWHAHGKRDTEELENLLNAASIPRSILRKYAHELSGGEQQRVAFAMGLAMQAEWLILDEPTSSLDKLTASVVLNSAGDWAKQADRICFISSHDGDLLAKYCDKIILFQENQLAGPRDKEAVKESLQQQFPKFSKSNKEGDVTERELITIEKGRFTYGKKSAGFELHIDFTLPERSIVGISGRSGSGKSTLGRLLARYKEWKAGKIEYAREISSPAAIQYIPQDAILNFHPFQSLGTQLYPVFRKWNRGASLQDMEEFLEQLQIDVSWLQHSVLELSGGQRQKMLLARAMFAQPKVLIIDETFSALDHDSTVELLSWVNEIHKQHENSIVLISHDLKMLSALCDLIYIMSEGRIAEILSSEK